MSWSGLANNQMVSFTDAQTSPFTLLSGQSVVNSDQCMTKLQALTKYNLISASMSAYSDSQLVPKSVWSAISFSQSFIMNAVGVNSVQNSGIQIVTTSKFGVDWGDGTIDIYNSGTTFQHIYSTLYTGQIKILSNDLTTITSFFVSGNYQSLGTISISTTELKKLGLTTLNMNYNSRLFITGDVVDLPRSLLYIKIVDNNVSGYTSNLPQLLTHLDIEDNNTIAGSASGLPPNLTYLQITGANTIYGDTSTLPRNILYLLIFGSNTISGNTSDLPSSINSSLVITGGNTISGDTSGLPRNATNIDIRGYNQITGNTSGLTSITNLLYLYIDGSNTITGNTSNLPSTLISLYIDGNNTIGGDTSGLPATLNSIGVYGNNIIGGNVSNLPSASQIQIEGNNTIGGNISGLTSSIYGLRLLSASCSIYGDVSTLSNQITYFNIKSTGTLSGDLYYLPSNISNFEVDSYMNFTYTGSRVWSTNFSRLNLTVKGSWTGFNSTETDNLLIDLYQKYPTSQIYTIFKIKCSSNPKSTSTSDTAYAGLVTKIGAGNVQLL